MLLHISRTSSWALFGPRYSLTARLDLSPEERQAIYAHAIDSYEIFYDPKRDELVQRAHQADQRARALPWFSLSAQQMLANAGRQWLETIRYIGLMARAHAVFSLTVGDLVRGVTITNARLAGIRQIETAITEAVDHLNAAVEAGFAFDHQREDVLAPSEDDERIPPPAWPPRSRRW
jgi:hypothetical protein